MESCGEPAIVARLRASGSVFAEDEAALLIEAAGSPAALEAMVAQRVDGLPIEHIVGWADFAGMRVAVDVGVFVPRRRSELLAELAVRLTAPRAIVLDLCCGAGALGLALARAAEGVELHAVDVERAAVRCARRNLAAIDGRVYEGDLYAPLPRTLHGRIDVIVANAPYVPTHALDLMPREARLHEPLVTLDGGADGLAIQRRVAAGASSWLTPTGVLLVETSAVQADASLALMLDAGLTAHIESSDDLDATVVIARCRA